ncbi:hypothetical protein BC939DRAFT_392878, partial [Gamsiella multidivaricata]|uniref:uncharacterized protein n=1 Tax=Gamsiella multidivaricata TaxID=101098 RepID=UPI0022202C05
NSLPPSRPHYAGVWPLITFAVGDEWLVIRTQSFSALATSSLRLNTKIQLNVDETAPSSLLATR